MTPEDVQSREKGGWTPSLPEAVLMMACAGILGWQLLLPGFIGLANNGDFPKIAGRLCMGGADDGADNFVHFQSTYLRAPRFCWVSDVHSSEIVPAWIASSIQNAAGNAAVFDIRWLGAVHGLGFLMAYYLVLLVLRPLRGIAWLTMAILALWIFADVSYVAYFNSFYTDTAAILGAMAAMPALVLAFSGKKRAAAVVLFGGGALLFVTSKGQHGILGPLWAGLAIMIAWKARNFQIRVLAFVTAAVLMAGTWWILAKTSDRFRGTTRFNVMFHKILPRSPTPAQDLEELGLRAGDLQYIGMNAFTPGAPAEEWMRSFRARTSYRNIAWFCLRRPARALGILKRDLDTEAWQRRPENLSNYRREDGRPPYAKTGRFGSWSALRSWSFVHLPWHVPVWFGLVFVATPFIASRNFAIVLVTVVAALLGVGEFGIASLADGVETFRHLILFHLLTDFSIFFGCLWVIAEPVPPL